MFSVFRSYRLKYLNSNSKMNYKDRQIDGHDEIIMTPYYHLDYGTLKMNCLAYM